MHLRQIRLINFRNYESLTMELPAQGALFTGKNGAGKTNLLEAFSLLITGRSPRTAQLKHLIHSSADEAYAGGVFADGGEQSVGFSRGGTISVQRDSHTYDSLSALYQGRRGFIYFGPRDIDLVTGSPKQRRTFMDMILSQSDPKYLSALITYRRSLLERNRVLSGYWDPVLLDVYDESLSRAGAYITAERRVFARSLRRDISRIYGDISKNDMEPDLEYRSSLKGDTASEILQELLHRRGRDREYGFTSAGPHRDDLHFTAAGRRLTAYASQGQCRSVALALKLSTLDYLSERGERSLVIAVDDAFSDLDAYRRRAFFSFLKDRGQLFIAVHTMEESSYYRLPAFAVENGTVVSP
ncbi:MAG: DNA replication/repair protein RecF [Fibrobacterota bacterium]